MNFSAFDVIIRKSRTNVPSVGSVFNDTRKVSVLSIPETIKEKSTFRAKALRRELVASGVTTITPDEGRSLETSIFPLSFQVLREPFPFAYHYKKGLLLQGNTILSKPNTIETGSACEHISSSSSVAFV